MAGKRSYRDPCGVARALDLVGERWALLIVRELLHGPKRFTDLRAGLPELGPDVLSQRLRELEERGIVARGTLAPPAGSKVYELTAWGGELEPVVLALGRWGSRAPMPSASAPLSVDAFVVALRTVFDPATAPDASWTCELTLDGQPFRVAVDEGSLTIARGRPETADARIESDTGTLAAVLWHGKALAEVLEDGSVVMEGDRAAVDHLAAVFPAPVPAA
jgi:DNA-binding HxlR family transcriptional regulator